MNFDAALKKFGCSSVSLNNWIKQGAIEPGTGEDGEMDFSAEDVARVVRLREQYGKKWIKVATGELQTEVMPELDESGGRLPGELARESVALAKKLRDHGQSEVAASLLFFVYDNWEVEWS